jgi:hypothetical protein
MPYLDRNCKAGGVGVGYDILRSSGATLDDVVEVGLLLTPL